MISLRLKIIIRSTVILGLLFLVFLPFSYSPGAISANFAEAACDSQCKEIIKSANSTCNASGSQSGNAFYTCRDAEIKNLCSNNTVCTSEEIINEANALAKQINSSSTATGLSLGFTAALENAWSEVKVWFAWLPIAISGAILGIVGKAFDMVLTLTITDFGAFFDENLSSGVTEAWNGFRDIANIVMIAMFVYLAFNVMLGIETYGLKKFGVRILMIALLINFSLFFTKAIIDVSNVTAAQFRKAISVPGTPVTNNISIAGDIGNTITGGQGISGIFMHRAGIPNTWDSSKTLKEQDKGDTLMIYSAITTIFFLATAMVLLFGTILMFTRAVVFILLMLTSALAFAAFLIPNHGQKLWDKWWGALINNALFAPLFMLLLWAVITITEGFAGGKGGLGEIASGGVGKALFDVVIILGLLYGATKIASELSIAGASFAKNTSMKGFNLGLRGVGVGAALGIGMWGRNKLAGGAGGLASRIPGLRGLGVKLNKMSEVKHFSDTAAGKAAKSKLGLSFGADQSEAISKHMAKIASEKADGDRKTHQAAELTALNAERIAAEGKRDASSAAKEKLTEREGNDYTNAVNAEREVNVAIDNKTSSRQGLELKNQALREERDAGTVGRDEANTQIQANQNEIDGADANIATLAETLQRASQDTKDAKTEFEDRTGHIQKVYDARIKEADALLKGTQGIESQIKEVSKESYGKEGANAAAKEAIDRKWFTSSSVKEMAKGNIGKSDIMKLAEQMKSSSDRSDATARALDKKEASRDAKKDK